MTTTERTNPANHIAIIGMACRLPGAADTEQYWRNLLDGVESLTTFTDEQLLAAGVAPELVRSPHYVRSRGIIDGADQFDAAFFGFTPREAELLDPQHRVFLECAWHALEDAGYDPQQTKERIAVFGGNGTNWHLGETDRHPDVKKFSSPAAVVTSNDKDYLTTRVSYKLNLTGPSVNVQSACSTSLVATMLGMNSLLAHQCDMALVGGVTVETPEHKGYLYQDGGMESPDGHCRPFDAAAHGTVFSRGAGVLLLKRLDDAQRDRDHVYAVILDGAVNNDGNDKVGFTAPSVNGQVEVAIEAMERAGVSARTLSFVEAHGTATAMGDPIEVASLSQAFRGYTGERQYCALGSVKGNIGHTDVASGAASLIKVALALKHRTLPASLNYATPNPKIDFGASPFYVNTARLALARDAGPLRALINSFGVGGTNACAILQEPPPRRAPAARRPDNVLLLSARTPAALDAATERLRSHLERHPEINVQDAAYTFQVGRRHFGQRRALAFTGRDDLLAALAQPGAQTACDGAARPLAFVFPGQGNQFPGMGLELYQSEPVFRAEIDRCCDLLAPLLKVDLRDIMYARGDYARAAAATLNRTEFTQPAIFVTSYAMAQWWMEQGIAPDVLIGHSVGEYVAACLAGVFSLEDALHAVARRGQLIQALPGGAMLAVLAPEPEVLALLTPELSVAAVNGPQLTVVAGPAAALAQLEARLAADKVYAKRLDTSHAFHSAMMDAALPAFAETVAALTLRAPSLPIISTVTGVALTAEEATDPDYWVRHVRRTVRFADALRTRIDGGVPTIFLECGPGQSLLSAIKPCLTPKDGHAALRSMRAANESGSDRAYLNNAVGTLWTLGRAVSWDTWYGDAEPARVPLPGYPFERQRYALDMSKNRQPAAAIDDGKQADVGRWFSVPSWRRTLAPALLAPSATEAPGNWLLFDDQAGLAEAIAAMLERAGETVIMVRQGAEFQRADARHFTVRAQSPDDYTRLIGALKADAMTPGRILHLWNVGADSRADTWYESADATALAFYSPLYLQQACASHSILVGLHLIVAANGVFDIAGEAVTHPLKALAIGPCRVIGKELPAVRARFVDLRLPASSGEVPALAAQLIAEARLVNDDTLVAYRGAHRWTEAFDPLPLPPAADGLRTRLREGGVYLITGGVSGLGLFFAGEIFRGAERVTLVLTGRGALPERADWDGWLERHADDDPTSVKLHGLMALERQGANLVVAGCDCADADAMAALVDDVEHRYGAIHGVIHSAGIAGGGVISLKTGEMAAPVLRAKVEGALVLDRLFARRPLDFMLLFSSITSVLGEAGRVDYCAANNFMDALAHYRNQRQPGRITAVNWGAWSGFGMAARWSDGKAARAPKRTAARQPGGPWLRLAAEQDGQQVYDVLLDPEQDWVVNQHRVFGMPTLVGTGFLELLYRYAREQGGGHGPVLENLYFMAPLAFEPGAPRRVRLLLAPRNDALAFVFKSQAGAEDGPWQDHFMGEMRLGGTGADDADAVQLSRLRERCADEIDQRGWARSIERADGSPALTLGDRWDALRETHVGHEEWLASLAVPPRYADEVGAHPFHPALADVALAGAVHRLTDQLYLPMAYKRVSLYRPLPAKVWSHIRLHDAYQPGDATLTLDVTLYDGDGQILARLERYTLKNASSAAPASVPRAAAPAAAVAPAADSKDILPQEGRDALERILAARHLPQVIVCSSNLEALIEEGKPVAGGAKAEAERQDAPATHARPPLSTPYVAASNDIEQAVCEIWSGVLGIGPIGVNDNFNELGGNSLLAVQTVAHTAQSFQIDLPIAVFYQNPTVRGLADAIVAALLSLTDEGTLEGLLAGLEA